MAALDERPEAGTTSIWTGTESSSSLQLRGSQMEIDVLGIVSTQLLCLIKWINRCIMDI